MKSKNYLDLTALPNMLSLSAKRILRFRSSLMNRFSLPRSKTIDHGAAEGGNQFIIISVLKLFSHYKLYTFMISIIHIFSDPIIDKKVKVSEASKGNMEQPMDPQKMIQLSMNIKYACRCG